MRAYRIEVFLPLSRRWAEPAQDGVLQARSPDDAVAAFLALQGRVDRPDRGRYRAEPAFRHLDDPDPEDARVQGLVRRNYQ